ncbi:putative CCR4-NOT transcription complex subunit 10 [Cocos nucifera]|uniref:Putative CCR4-NOT transcription complex subunit 10 n=1 Tax=Cocos nucifera TaxID=13894 RepID=A0A8K0IQ08_COCNU|nr:putative CCR4-NOT transcription complex subunit 10 [Cocos nucifera]
MHNRDSSGSPAAVAGKDGYAEEDGILSVTSGLAQEAAILFHSRRYTECIDVLMPLLQKKKDDPKKSGEQMQAVSSLGSNVMLGCRGCSHTLHQFTAADAGSIAFTDDFDTSIITFNTAVILYHLHDYANALSVLEPLYQNLEPIDETTALHVYLLLLDIALSSQDASKVADVIRYMENSFGVSSLLDQSDNGSLQQQPLNQFKASGTSNITVSDASSSDSSTCANATENRLVGNFSDEALEYETLFSTLDGGNPNLGKPTTNDHPKTSADWAATATDLKLKMHLYKVRLLLLTRNPKTAKRELKLATNMVRGRDSSTELLLKFRLEYARGNHRKAIELLDTISNRTEPVMLKKPLNLAAFSQDRFWLVVYNCGLQHLVCGKPMAAACCFRQAILVFGNQPLFWLRFAECCLLASEKGLLGDSSSSEEIKVHVAGSGKWGQLAVDNVNSRYSYSDSTAGDSVISGDDDRLLISLSFARQCLLNAQLLLDAFDQKLTKLDVLDFVLDMADPHQRASCDIKASKTSSSTMVTANCNP